MKSGFLRLLFAGLLLFAQQAALTHAVWHAHHDPAPAADLQNAPDGPAGNTAPDSRLCVFDAAFGQVLGGMPGLPCGFGALHLETEHVAQAPRWYAASSSVPFLSRAPPVLL